jgi:hypothetical protein
MKFFYSVLLLASISSNLFAQQVSPTVIASAGASFQSSEFSLDYTLGETFVTTLTGTDITLTQGFHQPAAMVVLPGCTSPEACNYNPEADEDDGSCIIVGTLCDDGFTNTLNDSIGSDCSCMGDLVIEGCIAPSACNFDPLATIDDASCLFPGDNCDDGDELTVFDILTADCICVGTPIEEVEGCTDDAACNYNALALIDNGNCLYPGDPCSDGNSQTINDQYLAECICAGDLVTDSFGCTNPEACNFEPAANLEDGSCLFAGLPCDDGNASTENDVIVADCYCEGEPIVIFGCTFDLACNYNPEAAQDDGSCVFPEDPCNDGNPATTNDVISADCVCAGVLTGCTDPEADNYNELAVIDDGSCTYPVLGCTDATACNFDSNATQDDGSCAYPGCDDEFACNYDPAAACFGGECTYAEPNYGCDGQCLNDENSNGICDEFEDFGCTDETALNYDPFANSDDGTCIYAGCTDVTACNYNSVAVADDGSCVFPGCNDELACNYDSAAGCLLEGACTYSEEVYLDCDGNCLNDGNGNGICDEFDLEGCLDPEAFNYNPTATIDDGSCIYAGCTDASACNFDATATFDDSSCVFPGCTDSNACNYDSSAGCDDGSCLGGACTNPDACNYDANATCDDGSCVLSGCTDPLACNFDVNAGCQLDGSCQYPLEIYLDCEGNCLSDLNENGICDELDETGCTDPAAVNFNLNALIDDGSCLYAGCTDPIACNYDATVVADDGTCVFPGCTDVNACNFEPTAGCDDSSCTYAPLGFDCSGNCLSDVNNNGVCDELEIAGCIDPDADNYDENATLDNGSCIFSGCTDMNACNYNMDATQDDGSCTYPAAECVDCNGVCLEDTDGDGVCNCLEVEGCTNPASVNYNPLATEFDGSCLLGCMDSLAINYDPQANEEDGSCIYQLTGCTYPTACNFNPLATTEDNSCTFPGCNDEAACNYDPEAGCLLEGSCLFIDVNNNNMCDLYEVSGCTDLSACNFNLEATLEDGSCAYDTEETIDVSANSSYTYEGVEYTESGTYEFSYTSVAGCDSIIILNLTIITGVFEMDAQNLQIWPNPASSEVRVLLNGATADAIEVFDITGKSVEVFNRTSVIQTDSWASGAYILRIRGEKYVMERRLMVVH